MAKYYWISQWMVKNGLVDGLKVAFSVYQKFTCKKTSINS